MPIRSLPLETINSNPRYSRRKAKLEGKTRYSTGKPCHRGHEAPRNTASGQCIICAAAWKLKNRDAILEASKKYTSDPVVRAARRIYERDRNKKPHIAITARMRSRIYSSIVGRTKSWRLLMPYGIEELKSHLEKQFLPGMTWENMGLWEIDHIIPVKSFRIEMEGDDEFNACWAITNLRPMWKSDNRKKSATRTLLL